MYKRIPAKVIKGSMKDETIIIEGTDLEIWDKEWDLTLNPAAFKYATRQSLEKLPNEGTVYCCKRENGLSELFHESEVSIQEKETEIPQLKLLSGSSIPSTLGNWLKLCETCFGKESTAVKFLQEKVDKQGFDEPVIADESQMLGVIMHMVALDIKLEEEQINNAK